MSNVTGGTFLDYPVFNALIPKEGPRLIPANLNLTDSQTHLVDLQQAFALARISIIQTLYIDNSKNTVPVIVSISVTNQVIECPGNSQGYFAVLAGQDPKFLFSAPGSTQNVNVQFINVPVAGSVWPVIGPSAQNGVGASQVSDAILDATVQNNMVQAAEFGIGSGNLAVPRLIGNNWQTFELSSVANTTVYTGAPSFFISDLYVAMNAASLAAGTTILRIQDGATVIMNVDIPISATAATATVLQMNGMQYTSKANANALTIHLSTALTAGAVTVGIHGGICNFIG